MRPIAAPMVLAAALLAGCAGSAPELGTVLVTPGRFETLTCQQLAVQQAAAEKRERELSALIDKASAEPGGAVVATVAYRSDHAAAGDLVVLVHDAVARKGCAAADAAPGPAGLPPPSGKTPGR